jgi:hypothetical protein
MSKAAHAVMCNRSIRPLIRIEFTVKDTVKRTIGKNICLHNVSFCGMSCETDMLSVRRDASGLISSVIA